MPTSPLLRRLATLLASLALLFFVVLGLLPDGATRIHTWPWVFYTHLLLLAPYAALGFALLLRARAPQPLSARLLPVAALALAIATSASAAKLPWFSFEVSLLLWSACAVLGLCVLRAPDLQAAFLQPRWSRLSGLVVVSPVIASTLYWLENLSNVARQWGWPHVFAHLADYRNPYSFGHSNYTAGYALLCLPWMVALTWGERRFWRALWAALALVTAVNLFSSFSRGAVLAAVVTIGAFVVVYLARSRISRMRKFALALLLLAAGAALLLGNPRLKDLALRRDTGFNPNVGDVQRLGMLQGGLLLARERPFIGHGPGLTPFVYPEVRSQIVGGVETSYQLHNAPLQFFVDLGLAGSVALAALLFLLARAAWRLSRRADDTAERASLAFLLSAGSAYSLFGYAVFSVTDYQLNVPSILLLLSFHAGVLLQSDRVPVAARAPGASDPDSSPKLHYTPAVAGGLLLLLTAASFWPLSREWRAREAFWAAWRDTPATDIKGILSRLTEATAIQPWNPFYHTALGLQFADESRKVKERELATQLNQLARGELTRALQLLPAHEPAHAALGWLLLGADPVAARAHFRAALHLIPDRDTLHLGVALCELELGQADEAARQLALESLTSPRFILSPAWQRPPLDKLHAATIAHFRDFLAAAQQDPATPAWRQSALRYLGAWQRWCDNGDAPTPEELADATPEQRAFFHALAAPSPEEFKQRISSLPLPLRNVLQAWADPSDLTLLNAASPRKLSEPALAGALARLDLHPATAAELLKLPAPDGISVKIEGVYRLHYSIMERNLDGPGTLDLAPRLVDPFQSEVLGPLLPPPALIPAQVLLTLDHAHTQTPKPFNH